MAEQLVRALEGDFDPAAYRDEYRNQVLEFVQAKARGETVEFKKIKEKKPRAFSLPDLLEKSIRRAEEGRKSA